MNIGGWKQIFRIFFFWFSFAISSVLFSGDIDYQFLERELGAHRPVVFSQFTPGVKTFIKTRQKIIALTFDACGGKKGQGYHKKLIEYLTKHSVPATLFISGSWINSNKATFIKLSKYKLFSIENHGTHHRPLTKDGRMIYGIQGTNSIREMMEEIDENAASIEKLTGRRPIFYRPGTGYIDDIGVEVTRYLNQVVVNFNVVPGDSNPQFSARVLLNAMLRGAKPGAIIILHMNQPKSGVLSAVSSFVRIMRRRGYLFVKLEDYRNQLAGHEHFSFNEQHYLLARSGKLNLQRANLKEAGLKGLKLDKADLRWADLHGTDLRDVSFINANLSGANLANADFRRADLKGSVISSRWKKYIISQKVRNFKQIRWVY